MTKSPNGHAEMGKTMRTVKHVAFGSTDLASRWVGVRAGIIVIVPILSVP